MFLCRKFLFLSLSAAQTITWPLAAQHRNHIMLQSWIQPVAACLWARQVVFVFRLFLFFPLSLSANPKSLEPAAFLSKPSRGDERPALHPPEPPVCCDWPTRTRFFFFNLLSSLFCNFPFPRLFRLINLFLFDQKCPLLGLTQLTGPPGILDPCHDKRRRIGYKDRDMACFWFETRRPAPATTCCQCRKTPKCLTISSTRCPARGLR